MTRLWILAVTIGLLLSPIGMTEAKTKPGKGNKSDKWAQKQWKEENKYWDKQDKQADKDWKNFRKADAKYRSQYGYRDEYYYDHDDDYGYPRRYYYYSRPTYRDD